MTSLLAIFAFLAAVLYEGHSLRCEKCLAYGSTSCKGFKLLCKLCSDKCIWGFENNTLNRDMRLTAFKACHTPDMPPAACEAFDHSFRCSQLQMRLVTKCGRNMDPLIVPPINLTANGYKCPDCFIEGSVKECKTDKVIECMGRETECLEYHGKARRPQMEERSYSFKGCATPSACSLMNLLPGTSVNSSKVQYHCTPASKD